MALKQRHSTPGNRLAVLPNGEPDAPPSSGATYLAHPLFQDQLFSALSPDLARKGLNANNGALRS